jgi:hypothetical protein
LELLRYFWTVIDIKASERYLRKNTRAPTIKCRKIAERKIEGNVGCINKGGKQIQSIKKPNLGQT